MSQDKPLGRNPSITPSPSLRRNLERHHGGLGTTGRINQIWDRYTYLVRTEALRLTDGERQVLLNVMTGSLIDVNFLTGLELEVRDSDDYEQGVDAARTLLFKIEQAGFGARLATVEMLGF